MASARRKPQGPALLALGGGRMKIAFPMCVGGWTLTARFRCLIRPNPLVRPVPHNQRARTAIPSVWR